MPAGAPDSAMIRRLARPGPPEVCEIHYFVIILGAGRAAAGHDTAPQSRGPLRMDKTDGELILLWSVPGLLAIWGACFLLFPGFVQPMSPALTADEVAAFYRDPDNLARIRYSMILFNWFSVGLVPILALIAMHMRRMAHRTPILSYSFLGCVAGAPTLFLLANLFWLLAAYRPERDPALIQMFNDMAWVTFTSQVGFLVGQGVFLALAIYLDRQARPVFRPWVGHFNLAVAAALLPAAFVGLGLEYEALAWNGLLAFWVKNLAIAAWIAVMGLVLGQAIYTRRRAEAGLTA